MENGCSLNLLQRCLAVGWVTFVADAVTSAGAFSFAAMEREGGKSSLCSTRYTAQTVNDSASAETINAIPPHSPTPVRVLSVSGALGA